MFRGIFRLPFLSLLVAGLVLSGCEGGALPGAPSVPEFSASGVSPVHKVAGKHKAVGSTTVAAMIGSDGGSIELAGHTLTVPAGAVAHPTRFSLKLVENGFVEVDLRAAQASAAGQEVNVGKRGFATPVTLQLSYELAERVDDPAALFIAWVKPDGSLQPLRSSYDPATRTVTASLDHFSSYGLATP
jgi:hypothetical protein